MKASFVPRREAVIRSLVLALIAISFSSTNSFGLDDANLLSSRIQKILSEKIPYAEIRLPNLDKLVKTAEVSAITELRAVRLIEDRASGVALIELTSTDGSNVRIQTPYQAMVNMPIAVRRIYPNTRLKKEDFRMENINVATGLARDYRSAIILDQSRLEQMETRQSILEGQFVVSNAVQKLPDVRKGETVKLELGSGNLTLTTAATVLENASIGERVRVLTAKTKREVVGKVREDHSVEVSL
jgi:flagella basal body P-ring formation protein FlgA